MRGEVLDRRGRAGGIFEVARRSLIGEIPERYKTPLDAWFRGRLSAALQPGATVLDVGAGRRPSVAPDERPPGCTWVGLDISGGELAKSPRGGYDEIHVADITDHVGELDGRFDLVVSFQVLEHVRSLDEAIANIHRYLKPGGRMVVQFSGAFSPFAVANRLLPHSAARFLVTHLPGTRRTAGR